MYNELKCDIRASCVAKLFHGVHFNSSSTSTHQSGYNFNQADDPDNPFLANSIKSHACFGKYSGFEFRSLLGAIKMALTYPNPNLVQNAKSAISYRL